MLGILFTAAPSTDVVKELQDKVISLHEHEVSFLNDTIANMLSVVGIGVAIITAVFSVAFVYVSTSNKRAQEKMNEAQDRMIEANKMMKKAEEKISDLELKISETNNIVKKANNISNIAQEKLEELEKEQKEIKEFADRLESGQKADTLLNAMKLKLDSNKKMIEDMYSKEDSRISKLISIYNDLESQYSEVTMDIGSNIMYDKRLTDEQVDKLRELSRKIAKLAKDLNAVYDDISNKNKE